MPVAPRQAAGSKVAMLLDLETGFKTPRTGAAKRPTRLAFASSSVKKEIALEASTIITSDRNPAQPREGAIDVGGDLSIPVDKKQIGYFLSSAIGIPASVETPSADSKTGSPTVTISGGSGAYTFSAAQSSSAAGDRVILEKNGVRTVVFITTRTDADEGVMSKERDAATPADDITAATVIAIIPNQAESSPGDVTIASGVATFETTQTNAAAGMQIVYQTNKRAILVADLGADAWSVVDGVGRVPANTGGAVDLEALEAQSLFTHAFSIHPSNAVSSFTLEQGHTDPVTPYHLRFSGVKVNGFKMEAKPNAEILATPTLVGANQTASYLPYDHESKMSGTPTISISSGTATFSVSQSSAAVGDKVIYTPTGSNKALTGYLGSGSGTTWAITDEDGTNAPDVSGATVNAVYTAADDDSSAVAVYGDRFEATDATVKIDGVASEIVTAFAVDLSNELDTDSFTLFNRGERRHLAEGTAIAGGTFEALFEDEELIRIAAERTAKSFELRFDHQGESLSFLFPVVQTKSITPEVSGGGGLRIPGNFFAYKPAGGQSAIIATLINKHEHYA